MHHRFGRRAALKGSLGVAAAALAGGVFSRTARAAFGEPPPGAESLVAPAEFRAESILEIFLYGGYSPYESFYCVEKYGKSNGTQWHAFLESGEVESAVDACGFTGALLEDFGEDADGALVRLGPFVKPLRDRSDIVSRMRMLVASHDLQPHEAAIPLALTGLTLGNPRMAGLGAHIQRHFHERDGIVSPLSFVIYSSESPLKDALLTASARGVHPASAKPFPLRIDAGAELAATLSRSTVGDRASLQDQYVALRTAELRARTTWKGGASPLRASRLDDFEATSSLIARSAELQESLAPSFFEPTPGTHCEANAPAERTAMSMRLAAHLLTGPSPARYTCVVDSGLKTIASAGGYDAHDACTPVQARNLASMLRALDGVVKKPGEDAPGKIDLDRTMVIINTEFGRTPGVQGNRGRGHWPYAYPVILIGGPINGNRRGVYGGSGPDARGTTIVRPAEIRAAALQSLGIWPFSDSSFNVSDIEGHATEPDAAGFVLQNHLGFGAS